MDGGRGYGGKFWQPNSTFGIMEKRTARKTLALKRKTEFIEVVDNPSKLRKTIADEFCNPCNTLSTILKEKEQMQDIDQAMLRWFTEARYM